MGQYRLALALAAAALAAAPAQAVPVSTSPRPDSVSVTVYRAPGGGRGSAMDLEWLNGYALITERRTVDIREGESDLRFEGVAGGILPESAIVTGLPDGVVEKNQDAYLLSPASLLDRSLGRRVHLRRTSNATGAVREEDAVIRSGAAGGVVLQTAAGYEALRCTGLKEQVVYDGVPEDLSARPTLSVRTRSPRAASATVTLSYLASNFDWQANYVATLSPDATRMDLFAWVTLANGDETSFRDAQTQAVAGRVKREQRDEAASPLEPALQLRCWPSARTSDVRRIEPPPPPPPAMPMYESAMPITAMSSEDIVVSGARMARQEELGDLKLYRIPDPVTVAAHSQKQVAFLDRKSVPVEIYYRARVSGESTGDEELMIRTSNRPERGLGLPLPAGRIALFQPAGSRPILLGETSIEDKAVGEKVEIAVREAENIDIETDSVSLGKNLHKVTLTVANSLPEPVWFEAEIYQQDDEKLSGFGRDVKRDEGKWVWRVRVPANSERKTSYRRLESD